MTDDHDAAGADTGRRMGVLAFLAAWVVLTGVQLVAMRPAFGALPAVFAAAFGSGEATAIDGGALAAGLLLGLVFQVTKVLVATLRLRDLGRPLDDAMWGLVPLANVGLFFLVLLRAAPKPADRARRLRAWSSQHSVFSAITEALPHTVALLPLGLLGAVVPMAVELLGVEETDRIVGAAAASSRSPLYDLVGGVVVLIGVYTAVQAFKAFLTPRTVTRGSWWPSLLLLPALLVYLAWSQTDTSRQGAGPVLIVLVTMAWQVGPAVIAGGFVSAIWIVALDRHTKGASTTLGAVWAGARPILAGTIVIYGVRALIVQLGIQVIVPGLWFATSYAFADLLAALDPEAPALRRSSELVGGIRGKVFKLLFVWAVAGSAVDVALNVVSQSTEQLFAAQFDPSLVPTWVVAATAWWWGVVSFWILGPLLLVFREREALWTARQAREASLGAARGDEVTG